MYTKKTIQTAKRDVFQSNTLTFENTYTTNKSSIHELIVSVDVEKGFLGTLPPPRPELA